MDYCSRIYAIFRIANIKPTDYRPNTNQNMNTIFPYSTRVFSTTFLPKTSSRTTQWRSTSLPSDGNALTDNPSVRILITFPFVHYNFPWIIHYKHQIHRDIVPEGCSNQSLWIETWLRQSKVHLSIRVCSKIHIFSRQRSEDWVLLLFFEFIHLEEGLFLISEGGGRSWGCFQR